MKQKDLEIQLTQFKNFKEPKIHLEQYQTPPRLVAMITWRALHLGDIKNKIVADFCSGTGLFAISAKILGAKKVYAIEVDPAALKIAKENVENIGLEIEFIEKDVREINMNFDTVLMNSPFGVKGTIKDQEFLRAALCSSKVSYSLHLFQEKNVEFLRKFVLKNNKTIDETMKAEFEIPKIYHFHKKRYHVIEVAILRCV